MTTAFKIKDNKIEKIAICEFLQETGKVKRDPNNVRLGGRTLESDYSSLEKRITALNKKTLENNTDRDNLKDSLSEGYDLAKQNITLMDLVDYLIPAENYELITDFYKEDRVFVTVCNKINSLLLSRELEELDAYRNNYWVLIGGNSRISTIYDEYINNKTLWDNDGSLQVKIDVNIVNYNYIRLFSEVVNYERLTKDCTEEDYEMIRDVFHIAYELLALSDNALAGTRNNSMLCSMNAKGAVGRRCINAYPAANSDKKVNINSPAKKKIALFQRMFKASGLGTTEILNGLLFMVVNDAKGSLTDVSELHSKEIDYFTQSTSARFSNYVARVIASATSSIFGKEIVASERAFKVFGINISSLRIENLEKFKNAMIILAKHYCENDEISTYVGARLRSVVMEYDEKDFNNISKCKKILSSAVKEANNSHKDEINVLLARLKKECNVSIDKTVRLTLKELKDIEKAIRGR